MKYAIFGGAGFLGTHLKNYLRKQGHVVYILDNMLSGNHDNGADPYFFDCDISTGMIAKLPQVDYIVNMASMASPYFYRDNGLATLRAGSVGVDCLCKIALDRGIPLLHISTAKLIGLDLTKADSYDISKLFAEQTINEWRKKGLKAKVARLYNVYGEGMLINDGRVVPAFIKKALENKEPIIITANPEFSLTYVKDIIFGLNKFMDSEIDYVVFGNENQIRIFDLGVLILRILKKRKGCEIKKTSTLKGLPVPDISIARAKLNWKPTTKLEDGLKIMIKDFRRRINGH